ncbi:MAG: hypothetical protein FWH06_03020 [Oscillospiraceae bacterium]|nr:hypothetical protein [Oscillospiraceae bacterium]
MKRWRVGSLSMGLILVASGAVMLVSLMADVNLTKILMTCWPVIMICLGIEILLQLFVKRDDADTKLRYDALSIIFISFILFVSALFYAAVFYLNLLGDDVNVVFGIKNDHAYVESGIELEGADELAVFNGAMSIKVFGTQDGAIRVEYSVSVNTNDMEYAQSVLQRAIRVEPGERAYLLTGTPASYNYNKISHPAIDCVIYLPRDKLLDLSQFYGYAEYDQALEGQIIR